MELKKDTTDNQKFAYEDESRPNPNDSLFGNIGGDDAYRVPNTYTVDDYTPANKRDIPNWVLAAVAVLVLIVAGGIVYGEYKKNNRYNGVYELVAGESQGQRFDIDELEKLTGINLYARIEIKGKEATLKMDMAYLKREGTTKIKVDGNTITFGEGSDSLTGVFIGDGSFYFEESGAKLIFEKID